MVLIWLDSHIGKKFKALLSRHPQITLKWNLILCVKGKTIKFLVDNTGDYSHNLEDRWWLPALNTLLSLKLRDSVNQKILFNKEACCRVEMVPAIHTTEVHQARTLRTLQISDKNGHLNRKMGNWLEQTPWKLWFLIMQFINIKRF